MNQHMRSALEEARKGAAEGGIPIGAALNCWGRGAAKARILMRGSLGLGD